MAKPKSEAKSISRWGEYPQISGSEAGSYLRRIDQCVTQLKAQGPSRTCTGSKEAEEEKRWSRSRRPPRHTAPTALYRGTSLIRKRPPLGPYSSPMPRALWWSRWRRPPRQPAPTALHGLGCGVQGLGFTGYRTGHGVVTPTGVPRS